jgi:small subunit ribosomal protein S9
MESKLVVSGKRKASVARAEITKGNGKVTINNKPYSNLSFFDRLRIEEPLKITENILGKKEFNVSITVRGGGEKSQLEASRLALARAIEKFSKSEKLRKAFLDYDRNLLVADVRRKEPYKPGDSKARSMRQSSKR